MRSFISLLLTVIIAWAVTADPGYCGGGPETTLVIVNGDSPLSLTVANEYVKLRHIPQSHIVWLHGIPSLVEISVDTFRKRIWGPIGKFIFDHDLDDEIDVIAYSADFPYLVNYEEDKTPYKIKFKPPISRGASLTGFTFFANRVESKDIRYLSPRVNRYFRFDRSSFGIPQQPHTDDELKLLEIARRAFEKQDYLTAEINFSAYVDKRPSHAAGWYKLAETRAALGKRDQAFKALSEAVDRGFFHVFYIQRKKLWDPYRNHPLFRAVIKRIWEKDIGFLPPLGFKHKQFTWANQFSFYPSVGANYLDRYYLSTLLAYTGERGNSLSEIYAYLRSAAASDGTQPDGTVYLMNNNNVRSTTRQPFFPATVNQLKRLGRKAEIISRKQKGQNGIIPLGKQDIIGVVAGTKAFNWSKSNSKFIPGAIAESLTSYGAKFASRKQTKLTEFLRQGAAGSSGAVAEPFAVQDKFPMPYMHVYYAAGCSLAEVFYQSVAQPYQLLIVGDPLARPFARFAKVRIDKSDIIAASGNVKVSAEVTPADDRAIDKMELWIDGYLVGTSNMVGSLQWDTTAFSDGYHELRVVVEETDWVGTRSYAAAGAMVTNTDNYLIVGKYDKQVGLDQAIAISGVAPGAEKIEIRQGLRVLKTKLLKQSGWNVMIPSASLGMGSVQLSVKASYPDGSSYISYPLAIEIFPPKQLSSQSLFGKGDKGILLTVTNAHAKTHQLVLHPKNGNMEIIKALKKAQIHGPFQNIQMEGGFYVEKTGYYQFVVKTDGNIGIVVDGIEPLQPIRSSQNQLLFIPMNLQIGWHDLVVTLSGEKIPRLNMMLSGESVAQPLSDKILRQR